MSSNFLESRCGRRLKHYHTTLCPPAQPRRRPHTSRSTAMPQPQEKSSANSRYSKKCRRPSTILSAPRLVILVAGPVTMKAAADVFQQARQHIGVGVAVLAFRKAAEAEKRLVPVKGPHQHPGRGTAQNAGTKNPAQPFGRAGFFSPL